MANVANSKKIKIKPENRAQAEGTVVKCSYAGETRLGIGPLAKCTHHYKVLVAVEGLEKPLVLKVKEKAGWNAGIVQDFKSADKAFGGDKPINEGETLFVVYDSAKPKKCFLSDEAPVQTNAGPEVTQSQE